MSIRLILSRRPPVLVPLGLSLLIMLWALPPRAGVGQAQETAPAAEAPADSTPAEADAAATGGDLAVPLAEPEPLSPEAQALADRFETQRLAWAETLAEMRAIQIRYNNRVDRSAAKLQQYAQLRDQAREQLRELFGLARELFALRNDHFNAASTLATTLDYRRENSVYEDSFQAAKLLIEADAPMTVLYLMAARSAFVEGYFDEVMPMYEKFIEAEGVDELETVDQQIGGMLETYPPRWETEVQRRQADAAADDLPRVLLETTRGPVVLELFENEAPNTVANFIHLVEDGFYDETEFYQVISDLLAIGGDPLGDGTGTSGRFIPDEHDHPQRRYIFRGSLFMAKVPISDTGEAFVPNSASSQFIIAMMPMMPQDQTQTVFGRVIEGMDVVGAFQRLDPQEKKDQQMQLPPDRILTARVIRKRDHDYPVTYAPR